jgi:hypothetical protein
MSLAAAGACAAQTPPPRSFDDWRRLLAAPDAAGDAGERMRLLAEGEARLAAGDASGAYESFQRAAMLMHAPDTECSIVRAQMQAGDYRQALAFGAHAALAHRGYPAGSALYAWLLHAGGQAVIAARLLDDALALAPDDAALRLAKEQLRRPWPRASGPLLTGPIRSAPYAHGTAQVPASARTVGTGVLIDGGHAALAPLATVGAAQALWLRNGVGDTVSARVASRLDAVGFARLRLDAPLPMAAGFAAAHREPFAGSPATTVEFACQDGGDAAWPLLRQGFLGRAAGESPLRLLGIELPPGPRGGPVFDRAGRLAGIATTHADGRDRFVTVAALAAHGIALSPPAMAELDPTAAAIDGVYETALRVTLQVLVSV